MDASPITEAYSIEEIAALWADGELQRSSNEIHGWWRIREIEPYLTNETRRSAEDLESLENEIEDQGYDHRYPVKIALYKDGSPPEVISESDRVLITKKILSRKTLIPVRFVFRDSHEVP